jgi:hypothetical protein
MRRWAHRWVPESCSHALALAGSGGEIGQPCGIARGGEERDQ